MRWDEMERDGTGWEGMEQDGVRTWGDGTGGGRDGDGFHLDEADSTYARVVCVTWQRAALLEAEALMPAT